MCASHLKAEVERQKSNSNTRILFLNIHVDISDETEV